jgi:hypothetical protein
MLPLRHLIALLPLLAAGIAPAQEAPSASGLRLSGFGTLGVLHADAPPGWGFLREDTQPLNSGGTRLSVDTRVGVQANYALDERIELVAQVVLKDRVRGSRLLESLEWAFVAYRPTPNMLLRVGRLNADIYMLSDLRNVGFAYPWVRPSVDYYGALPLSSIDGADISHTWDFGDVRWRVKAFVGAQSQVSTDAPRGEPTYRSDADSIFGASMSREAGGLTLRANVGTARVAARQTDQIRQVLQGFSLLQSLPLPAIAAEAGSLRASLGIDRVHIHFIGFGAAYETGAWQLSAELAHIGGGLRVVAGDYGYVSAGRRFGDFTVYGMLGRSRAHGGLVAQPEWAATLAPLIGPEAAGQAQGLGTAAAQTINHRRVDQRSVSLGVRWDLHPQVALKLQWDHYRIGHHGSLLWANGTDDAARANVGTLVMDFVF